MKQAVQITNKKDYKDYIDMLTLIGYKPFELCATFKKSCFISCEDRYIQFYEGTDCFKDYEIVSFMEFKYSMV